MKFLIFNKINHNNTFMHIIQMHLVFPSMRIFKDSNTSETYAPTPPIHPCDDRADINKL